MNEKVFCDEPIIGVYLGQQEDVLTYGRALFLDCYQEEITLYLTPGFRYVLETEHFGISLEYDGVFLLEKGNSIESLKKDSEWFDPFYRDDDPEFAPWVDHEYTLFTGERLICVEEDKIFFDNLRIKICKSTEEEIASKSGKLHDCKDHQMYGFDRYLTKKCACGGRGLTFLDFVNDYYVICEKCGKRIPSDLMNLQDAIEEWNGEAHWVWITK